MTEKVVGWVSWHDEACHEANEEQEDNPVPGVYHCICKEPPLIEVEVER